METTINQSLQKIISSLNNEIEYYTTINNWVESYYHCLPDQLALYDRELKEHLKTLIENSTNYEINDDFIQYLVDEIDPDEYFFNEEIKHIFSTFDQGQFSVTFPLDEIEIDLQYHTNNTMLESEDKKTVEYETSLYITEDQKYGYYTTDLMVVLTLNDDQILKDLDSHIENYNYNEVEILIDSSSGQYIPLRFINEMKLDLITGVDQETIDDIKKGPDHEFYYDSFDRLLCNAISSYSNKTWRFNYNEDGDLCAYSQNYIFTDQ